MASKDKGAAQGGPVGHWPDLHPVPTFEEAMAGLKVAVGRLTGATADNVKAAYAAEVALLFGTAQIPHDEHPPLGITARGSVSDEEAAKVLEGALATHGQRGGVGAEVMPWGSIISVLLPLLLKWLSNR